MKKLLCYLLAAIVLPICFSGCSDKTDNIRISYVSSPFNVPSILEKQSRYFEADFKPAEVKWFDLTTGPQQTQALASGDLDFAHAIGSPSVLLAASQGLEMKIIGVYSRSPKSFMILTKNGSIQTVADLKGKKVGGPMGTVLDQLLAAALAAQNLTEQDVEFINMDIPSSAAALEGRSIDAALLAGPVALKAMDAGARLITDGQGLVDGLLLSVVSKDYYDKHPDAVDRFRLVHQKAIQYMYENEAEILSMAAKEVGITDGQAKTLYSWYDFDPTIRQKDIDDLNNTQAFLIGSGLQQSSVDVDALVSE